MRITGKLDLEFYFCADVNGAFHFRFFCPQEFKGISDEELSREANLVPGIAILRSSVKSAWLWAAREGSADKAPMMVFKKDAEQINLHQAPIMGWWRFLLEIRGTNNLSIW